MFYSFSKIGVRQIVDGSSNTVMIGECKVVPDYTGTTGDFHGRYWDAWNCMALFSTFTRQYQPAGYGLSVTARLTRNSACRARISAKAVPPRFEGAVGAKSP